MKCFIFILGLITFASAKLEVGNSDAKFSFDRDVSEEFLATNIGDVEDLLFEEGSGDDTDDVLPLAEACDAEICQLPDCRCSSTDIPGQLAAKDTPQFVIVTFDGAVTSADINNYREVLYNRRNKNQCSIGTTFFVPHHYTNYQIVNELYNRGFEIALNSITLESPKSYWAEATYDVIKEQIADQKIQMSHFAKIPQDEIKGVRMPFLQMAGNNSFLIMSDYDLTYDLSWSTQSFTNPGLWPYTLDYASIQDCQVPPCPTASIPGVWVLPGISWFDLSGLPCNTVGSCHNVPDRHDEEAWFKFFVTNFERHYLGSRAPFPFFIRGGYMNHWPAVKAAYIRFFDLINNLSDVFMVNADNVIDWVKDPVPVNEYMNKPCKAVTPTDCDPQMCVLTSEHNNHMETYWMTVCDACPKNYPWIGNPLGLEQ